jgi:hypothetical protein
MATPRWLRISVVALLFLSAVANMRKGVFEWGPLLCLGLMLSVAVDRRQGESLTSHLRNPRSIVAILFGICAMAGNIYSLAAH